ncbi:MAG: multidrug DMT transporter permease [Planctomycetota bacterium]|nr:MAG: multidrug DMT transporter permease [Planctomycetota bacterium]
MSLYYVSLAGAYRSGELSIVYPLARSSPAIVVSIVTLFFSQGNQISILCIIGILFIVMGCFLIPVNKFSEIKIKNYLNLTCGLALLAAMGTAGYSIIDDEALRQLRNNTNISINNIQIAIIYACLQAWIAFIWLLFFVSFRRQGRLSFAKTFNEHLRYAMFAGVAIHITYLLVLISFEYAKNVSYVVGFRQLSIPLGVLCGIVLLKEPSHKLKLIGVGIVFIGLILVALG